MYNTIWGFPDGASGEEPACHCRLDIKDAVQSLAPEDLEDPLGEGMATHFSILA